MEERKQMSAQILEEFRQFLLIRSAQAGPNGISLDLLRLSSQLQGFDCNQANVEAEARYLLDLKFLTEVEDTLSKGQLKVRIFATGRQYLEQHGFPSL